jgi:hypothetical protein
MDFTKPILLSTQSGGTLDINSIAASDLTTSLGPRSGYKVMATSFGASNAVGYVDKRAVDDGVDVGDAYLTGRQIDIQCAVFGSTLADFHSKMQELSDIMRLNPRYYDSSYGFRELKFSQATIDTTTYTDGVAPLRCVVRPMGVPNVIYNQAASIDHSVSTSATRGFSATMNLSFIAKEPYRFRQTQRQISINTASVSASAVTTSLPNVGTAFARPIIEIIHPSSTTAGVTITSISFVIDSKTVKVNNLVFDPTDTNNETRWFIDFDAHAVYKGVRSTAGGAYVQTLRLDVIDLTYFQFGTILAKDDGTSVLTTTWTGTVRPDGMTAKYYEAYY